MKAIPFVAGLVVIGVLGACASTQLNYNAKELASSAIDLITAQVLDNLARFAANPNALPS